MCNIVGIQPRPTFLEEQSIQRCSPQDNQDQTGLLLEQRTQGFRYHPLYV